MRLFLIFSFEDEKLLASSKVTKANLVFSKHKDEEKALFTILWIKHKEKSDYRHSSREEMIIIFTNDIRGQLHVSMSKTLLVSQKHSIRQVFNAL